MDLRHDSWRKNDFTRVLTGWAVQGMSQNYYQQHIKENNGLVILDVAKGGGQADRTGASGASPKPLYWIAPETYHGNRLGSYGGKLTYTIMWDEELKDKTFNNAFERLNVDPDITLTGGGISIYFVSNDHSTVYNNKSIEIVLMENNFFNLGTKSKISRDEMLTVLKDLSDIKIKASYPIAVSEIAIQNMRLQDTDFTDRLPASYKTAEAKEYAYSSRVEVCSCPEGHIGSSCETCKDGYYWDRASPNPNQKCKKCKCHGHCDKCDDEGYPFITERQWDSQIMSASGAPEDSVQIYYSQLNYSDDIPIERYSYEIPAL